MKEIKAIIEPSLVPKVLKALEEIPDLPDVVLSEVTSCSRSAAGIDSVSGVKQARLEIAVPSSIASEVVYAIAHAAHSESSCDSRIFVTDIAGAANIRDIESGVVE